MVNLDIEEIGREEGLLIRSCRVKINGNTVITPTKTIGATLNDSFIAKQSVRFIGNKFKPFGEVYCSLSLNKLSNTLKSAAEIKKFNTQLHNKVALLKEAGALPYILLSITEEGGAPLNRLLPPDAEKFIFNLLWGTLGNSIIVTPLLGILPTAKDYSKMIEAFYQRQQDAIDRKNQPLMAIIPPSYSLVDPKLIEKYWKRGVRIFGYNCENTKYGAYGPLIESLHYELSKLSKESEEEYILNAINSKFKYGKQRTSRINNLIGSGYGFDTYSPNHIRPRNIARQDKPKYYIFDENDYGFLDLTDLNKIKNNDNIVNTSALKTYDLDKISELTAYGQKKLADTHNIEKTIKEIENYPSKIENNELLKYLSDKEKIKIERTEIASLRPREASEDEW